MTDNAKLAQRAGYYVREGEYRGTTDNRLGRWYYGHASDTGFRPFGPGHASKAEAWAAAYEHGRASGRLGPYEVQSIGRGRYEIDGIYPTFTEALAHLYDLDPNHRRKARIVANGRVVHHPAT
jgi:hypothetical protein